MDSIDPGADPASLMGAKQTPAAPAQQAPTDSATLDKQILALAATPAASAPDGGKTGRTRAAKGADDAEQAAPARLTVGLGPWYVKTPVPIPHWLDNTIGGSGGRALQLRAGNRAVTRRATPDPLAAAVAQQQQTGAAGKGALGICPHRCRADCANRRRCHIRSREGSAVSVPRVLAANTLDVQRFKRYTGRYHRAARRSARGRCAWYRAVARAALRRSSWRQGRAGTHTHARGAGVILDRGVSLTPGNNR